MKKLVDLTRSSSRKSRSGGAMPLVVKTGESISRVPLDRLVTLAVVVDLTERSDPGIISRSDIARIGLAGFGGCLLRTDWSDQRAKGGSEPAPILSVDAAAVILEAGVRTIAADFPIIGTAEDLLLHNRCVLIHCLSNLAELVKPVVRLVALPLKLEDSYCADARVIAIEE